MTLWKYVYQIIKMHNKSRPPLPRARQPTHRQYEALRAFFVEGLCSAEAARRFGYTRELSGPLSSVPPRTPTESSSSPPPRPQAAPKTDPLREQIVALRKKTLSIYDIRDALREEGQRLSPAAISVVLKEEGFARLPRRRDDERPLTSRPQIAPVADVRQLDLSPRRLGPSSGALSLSHFWPGSPSTR